MSNEVAVFGSSPVPAHLQGHVDDMTKSLMGGNNAKRISIKGGVFRMLVAGKEVMQNTDRAMNFVIVNAAESNSRSYYKGQFDNNSKPVPPDCWSNDSTTPAKEVKNPQSSTCAMCPQNIKGSGQGDSRACRYSRRLAVVLANDIEGDIYALSLPAASIFGDDPKKMGLNSYARYLAAHQGSVNTVVTEFRFDTDVATPKLMLKPIRWLNEAEFKSVEARKNSVDAMSAIQLAVHQVDRVEDNPPPEGTRPTSAPAPATAAAPRETALPADAEPVKRDAATTQVKDAKAVLQQWADD